MKNKQAKPFFDKDLVVTVMPMAQEKTKPMFLLKPGEGAIGSHFQAVQACYKDFKELTNKITSTIHFIRKAQNYSL